MVVQFPKRCGNQSYALRLFLLIGAVVLVLGVPTALAADGTFTGLAVPPEADPTGIANTLTAADLPAAAVAAFQAEAAAAGLTPSQIASALADPYILLAIPTSEDIGSYGYPVGGGTGDGTAFHSMGVRPLSGTGGCTAGSYSRKLLNVVGTVLAQYDVSKYFCWNGSQVTSAPPATKTPKVTTAGGLLGWQLNGNPTENAYWTNWGGHTHGGHRSDTQGHFKRCVLWVCIGAWDPTIRIEGHYNGTYAAGT